MHETTITPYLSRNQLLQMYPTQYAPLYLPVPCVRSVFMVLGVA